MCEHTQRHGYIYYICMYICLHTVHTYLLILGLQRVGKGIFFRISKGGALEGPGRAQMGASCVHADPRPGAIYVWAACLHLSTARAAQGSPSEILPRCAGWNYSEAVLRQAVCVCVCVCVCVYVCVSECVPPVP